MLIRIGHSINLSASASEDFIPLLVCAVKVRHVRALPHRSALVDLIYPVLEGRELREIDLQHLRTTADPRVVGDVGDCVLRARQVGALFQTGFQDRVKALGLVDVPLDGVVGADTSDKSEVVCLA